MSTSSTQSFSNSSASLQSLREAQAARGASLEDVSINESLVHSLATSFGNDADAIVAAQTGVALYDSCHWGYVEVADGDRLRFLHNQTTNDFMTLQPNQGCDTVFVTSTARTIDLVSAYVTEDSVLLLTSPGSSQRLIQWMDRFIFFADKVKLTNLTDTTAIFRLIGPESAALLSRMGAGDWGDRPLHQHEAIELDGLAVRVAVGSGLSLPGYTLTASVDQAAELWQRLADAQALPLGESVWEQLRLQQGRPLPGRELTDDYNPLEAGLWHTVSFNKGCYIGQETLARLDTYDGVKQKLWGIRLSAWAEPGSVVVADGAKIGRLTSAYTTPDGVIGLAYIRTKAGGPGLAVSVGDTAGEIVDVPFLTRSRH